MLQRKIFSQSHSKKSDALEWYSSKFTYSMNEKFNNFNQCYIEMLIWHEWFINYCRWLIYDSNKSQNITSQSKRRLSTWQHDKYTSTLLKNNFWSISKCIIPIQCAVNAVDLQSFPLHTKVPFLFIQIAVFTHLFYSCSFLFEQAMNWSGCIHLLQTKSSIHTN